MIKQTGTVEGLVVFSCQKIHCFKKETHATVDKCPPPMFQVNIHNLAFQLGLSLAIVILKDLYFVHGLLCEFLLFGMSNVVSLYISDLYHFLIQIFSSIYF